MSSSSKQRMAIFKKLSLICIALLALNVVQPVAASQLSKNTLSKSRLLLKHGQRYAALKCLNHLIAQEPNNAEAYIQRANTFDKLGHYREAVNDLTKAINFEPKRAELYQTRIDINYDIGELQKVVDDCAVLTKLNAVTARDLSTAATAYEELGDFDKAILFHSKVLKLKPESAFDWSDRGDDYLQLGQFTNALADWRKANTLFTPDERAAARDKQPLLNLDKSTTESPREITKRVSNGNPITLPFSYDTVGHIYFPAQVNGHRINLELDTGNFFTIIYKNSLRNIGAADKRQIKVYTRANGDAVTTGFFRSREFALGNARLSNVGLLVEDAYSDSDTINGILGCNILENYATTIDYAKKQITLDANYSDTQSKDSIVIPMILRLGVPYCDLKVNKTIEVLAAMDTGSPFGASSDALLSPSIDRKLQTNVTVEGPWFGILPAEIVRFKSLDSGQFHIEAPTLNFYSAAECPGAAKFVLLGNDTLSQFKKVTFDFPRRRLIFEPYEEKTVSASQLYSEATTHYWHNEMMEAINICTRLKNLDPDFAAESYRFRALANLALYRDKEALEDASKFISLSNRSAYPHYLRALIYTLLNRPKEAIADDTRAIQLAPDFIKPYENRAVMYEILGKHNLYERDMRTATRLWRKYGYYTLSK